MPGETNTETPHVDGATVTIGETVILVQGRGGAPAQLDHVSNEDGYAAYQSNGETFTLQFMEAPTDE